MADQDMMHTAEIVKAALPYIDTKSKGMAELFVKTFELMGSLKTIKNPNDMAACGFEVNKIDFEGLLNGIRPVCNHREREMIDRILNIFSMKRMFEMYNNIMETMKTMQEFGGFPFGGSSDSDDTDNVTSNFSTSNFEEIFRTMSNMSAFNNTDSSEPDNHDTPHTDTFEEESYSSDEKEKDSTSTNTNTKMDPMFEMLKTMIPPDKISTFENLSMLLNTMSYDNNSKSDDNKENNNA